MLAIAQQYIERSSGRLETERLYQDRLVLYFYGRVRGSMPAVFRMLTSRNSTRLLGYLNYDSGWGSGACRRFLRDHQVDLGECLDDPAGFNSARQAFERKIRYWECRPMPEDARTVASPCGARAGRIAARARLVVRQGQVLQL